MKRLLLVLTLMLLPYGVQAADVLETWNDYRVAMRRKLGYDTVSTGLLTDANAAAFIREAVVQIVPISAARKQITFIVTTHKDYIYALDTTLVEILSVWWSKNDTVKTLVRMPISGWSLQEHEKTTGDNSALLQRPSFYDFTDSLLLIYPTPVPKFGDTIRIMGIHRIAAVLTDSTLSEIPQQYRTSVLNYATWEAAFARTDVREEKLFKVLSWSLGKIGMAITQGGKVVPSNK